MIHRATVVLNKKNNVPKDAARNVWHFFAPDDHPFDIATTVGPALQAFYQNIQAYLAPSINATTNAHRIEWASVDENAAGEGDDVVSALRVTQSFTTAGIPSSSSGVLPNEVAAALSFMGDVDGVPEELGATRPRSRRRGRVFLGPLHPSVIDVQATTLEPLLSVTFRETVLDAYDTLVTAMDTADDTYRHTIYSRTDGLARIVQQVSMDNEPDTMRTRGRKPSLRMVRSVVQGAPIAARAGVDVALAT